MMETQLTELKKVIDVVSKSYIEKLESAIRRCYIELGESDVWMTMKCDACDVPNLKWATSLDLYGKINNGMVAYSGLIEEMEASFDAMQTDDSMCVSKLTETAVSFVEDRWIALHKEMSQWAVLEDFAHSSDCSRLKMECAWKARDWKKLRAICATPSVVASLEAGDIDVKMSEIFLAIADGKLNEVENLHAQTAQLCLYKWQLLPPVHSGCCAHIELLHSFHRLVDIRESGQIMVETRYGNGKRYIYRLNIH
jgi:transformation/transcription domain-associated protein